MLKTDLNNIKKIHFIGIGGSGLSALARVFLSWGKQVTGSDNSNSKTTDDLKKGGAIIHVEHTAENLSPDTDLVIYTIAAKENNPEILVAKKLRIKALSYPEVLGLISKSFFTIAVAGTHGKTTTTNMVGKVLSDAGFKPLVISGAEMQKGSFENSSEKYFVVEACEYRRSFLNIYPDIAIITNIDNDHLDYYKDQEDIKLAFTEFVSNLKDGGFVIADSTDVNLPEVIKRRGNFVDWNSTKGTDKLSLILPGSHNKKNALAALKVAELLGVDLGSATTSPNNFSGAKRRFDYKGVTNNGCLVYDDYAHHPTEIRATLLGAKETFPNKCLIAIFQPHLYSRTKTLLKDFASSFDKADEVIVLPIYASRESFDPNITSEILVSEINKISPKAKSMSVGEVLDYSKNLTKDDILITIGAGDVYEISNKIISKNDSRN